MYSLAFPYDKLQLSDLVLIPLKLSLGSIVVLLILFFEGSQAVIMSLLVVRVR